MVLCKFTAVILLFQLVFTFVSTKPIATRTSLSTNPERLTFHRDMMDIEDNEAYALPQLINDNRKRNNHKMNNRLKKNRQRNKRLRYHRRQKNKRLRNNRLRSNRQRNNRKIKTTTTLPIPTPSTPTTTTTTTTTTPPTPLIITLTTTTIAAPLNGNIYRPAPLNGNSYRPAPAMSALQTTKNTKHIFPVGLVCKGNIMKCMTRNGKKICIPRPNCFSLG